MRLINFGSGLAAGGSLLANLDSIAEAAEIRLQIQDGQIREQN